MMITRGYPIWSDDRASLWWKMRTVHVAGWRVNEQTN